MTPYTTARSKRTKKIIGKISGNVFYMHRNKNVIRRLTFDNLNIMPIFYRPRNVFHIDISYMTICIR